MKDPAESLKGGYCRPQKNFCLKGSIWTIIKGKWQKKYKRKSKRLKIDREKPNFPHLKTGSQNRLW